VIQLSPVPILGALAWAVLQSSCAQPAALGPASESSASAADPRQAALTQAGNAARRRFVPPFAYEAYVRGELALAAQRPDQAVLQFELATAAPDVDAFLLSRLAEALAATGEREAALRALAEAERVDACQEDVWLLRGKWAEAEPRVAGDAQPLERAEAAYQRALGCAPHSERARVALYRVWKAQGRTAEALKLLTASGAAPHSPSESVLLLHALAHDDVASVRFALDSWLGAGGLAASDLESALQYVVARNEPSLALTFKDFALLPLTAAQRARLATQSFDRAQLQALLAEHSEEALGGPSEAARYALVARDYERAELYATLAESRTPSDEVRAIKIEALSALGQHEAALSETRLLGDSALKQRLAREQLGRLGLSALAEELREQAQTSAAAAAAAAKTQ
jgi:tetratricopeptide (TPR) repeat protein